jgi:hypothetical protein
MVCLVENISIVGLSPGEVDFGDAPVYFTDAVGDLVSNAQAGLARLREINPSAKKILFASSDVPLITPEIIRGFVEECGSQEADGYYTVVEEKAIEARFPGSKRTFIPFKGGRYSGGDVLLMDVDIVKANEALVRDLTGSRKNYWKQAQMIGLGFILRFIFRTMTVHEAMERASSRLNFNAEVVETRFVELGMDLDKPHHYEIIKAALEERESQASSL